MVTKGILSFYYCLYTRFNVVQSRTDNVKHKPWTGVLHHVPSIVCGTGHNRQQLSTYHDIISL
jgi:hypothetical protein